MSSQNSFTMEMFYVDSDELDRNLSRSDHKNLGHHLLNESPAVAVPYLVWTIVTVVMGTFGNLLIIAAITTEPVSEIFL